MPLSATCRNCGRSKTPNFYHENYCEDCTVAVEKATAAAEKADADPGAARREALAERAHNVHNNRVDPRKPVSRADYWAAADPTRPGGER